MQTDLSGLEPCVDSKYLYYSKYVYNVGDPNLQHISFNNEILWCNCNVNKGDSSSKSSSSDETASEQVSFQLVCTQEHNLDIFNTFNPASIVHLNIQLGATHQYRRDQPLVANILDTTELPNLRHFSIFRYDYGFRPKPDIPLPGLIEAVLKHVPKLATLRLNYKYISAEELIRFMANGANLVDLELWTAMNGDDITLLKKYVTNAAKSRVGSYCPCLLLNEADKSHDMATCKLRHGPRPLTKLRWLTIATQFTDWSAKSIADFRRALPAQTLWRLVARESWGHTWYSAETFYGHPSRLLYCDKDFRPTFTYFDYERKKPEPDTKRVERIVTKPRFPLNVTNSGQLRSNYKKRPAGLKQRKGVVYDDDDDIDGGDMYDNDSDSDSESDL
ncbi:hypothetical protein GQ42DRAFT_165289, partial [Ramicandelaber brevisporus]